MKIHGYEVHPLAEAFPLLDDESMRRLGEDIQANGLQCPISLFGGKIIDGRNRALACKKHRIDPEFEELKDIDPAAFVVSMNLRRRHLNESQRAMVAARLATLSPGRPSAQNTPPNGGVKRADEAAELLNVSERSVERARAVQAANNPVLTRAVDDGVIPVSQAAKLAKLEPARQNEVIAKVRSGEQAAKAVHVSVNSGDNEWYTPPEYLDAAREVLGEFDLDPASSATANKVVKARRFFDEQADGLNPRKKWRGRVWMNPPYAQPLISDFCERLVGEYETGNVSAAIVLVNNGTETKWGQRLLGAARAVCFPSGRIRFVDPEGNPGGAPLQGQMVVYLGNAPAAFRRAFEDKGVVCERR